MFDSEYYSFMPDVYYTDDLFYYHRNDGDPCVAEIVMNTIIETHEDEAELKERSVY